jgi:hypothetical protein
VSVNESVRDTDENEWNVDSNDCNKNCVTQTGESVVCADELFSVE